MVLKKSYELKNIVFILKVNNNNYFGKELLLLPTDSWNCHFLEDMWGYDCANRIIR